MPDRALVAFYAVITLSLASWVVAVGGFAALQAGGPEHPEWVS